MTRSSSMSSATLVAINSISAATIVADDKQNHHAAVVVAAVATDNPLKVISVDQDEITSALDNSEREDRLFTPKSSTAAMKPDVGILSKDFSTKGREQPVDKQFTIHRKKQAAAVDVDVGILSNGRWRVGQWQQQKKAFDTNLHAKGEVTVRSLQSEEEFPYMCPSKNGRPGYRYIDSLFDKTDSYFPKCRCNVINSPNPSTCGPELCECLELDADGDILECMDPLKQLCEGTKDIDGIPGPWSIEQCLGGPDVKHRATIYCSTLPCFVDGNSFVQCLCNTYDSSCSEYRDARRCAISKCCQAQTDDEGREACLNGPDDHYYQGDTSFSISREEMISGFNECSFNSSDDKSIAQCYCEYISYGQCVNDGVAFPQSCEANICCWEQSEDDARLNCFSRFRDTWTGFGFYLNRGAIWESCIASGKSSDQCKCDIQGLSNCVFGIWNGNETRREPSCDLFQCCQSQTVDEGRKDCLVQDEAQLVYKSCLNDGNTTEYCYCDKSSKLCSSGHSDDSHCDLSSCCQEQADDTGRKECIDNFTTSQPSSAPSETTPAEDSIDEASPTATPALPGTSSAAIPAPLGAKSHAKATSKMLAVAAVIGWLLFS